MSRRYYVGYYVKVDNEEGLGSGGGGSEDLRYDSGEWRSDESLKHTADMFGKFLFQDLVRARDREMALDREAAKPFWLKWLG